MWGIVGGVGGFLIGGTIADRATNNLGAIMASAIGAWVLAVKGP